MRPTRIAALVLLVAATAAAFALVFAAVQWPFAEFLMTPWARNWFFATHHMNYMLPTDIQATWYQLKPAENILADSPVFLALAFGSRLFVAPVGDAAS